MDAQAALSKAGQAELSRAVYSVALIMGGVALLSALGSSSVSAPVWEKVGAADDGDETRQAEQAGGLR